MGLSPRQGVGVTAGRASALVPAACRQALFAMLFCAAAGTGAGQETHLIVISGVEADVQDATRFRSWAGALIEAAERKAGVAEANIVYLAANPDAMAPLRDKPAADRVRSRARSTREEVAKAFSDVAARAHPDDQVFIVLLGHGSFDGREASFNLPGPDLKAADYSRLLEKFGRQRIVFVNTTGSSGAFLAPLAAPGRTIVAATKTGGERLDTLFPEYFVEAWASETADKNRDGRISVLEAFEYAKARVTQVYQQKGTIVTEHAAIEDGSEGKLADATFLESPAARAAAFASVADPALRALLQERQALEDQVAALRARKAGMDAAEYERQLETLVTSLALKTRAIQQMEKKR